MPIPKWRGPLIAALFITAAHSIALAQQATVVDDTYVAAKKGPFGGSSDLRVSPSERTFIRFKSSLPAGTPAAHLHQATLKVFIRRVTVQGQIKVYRAGGAWSEETLTGAATPALTTLEGVIDVTVADENRWVVVPITPVVREWLDGVVVNDGIALISGGGTDVVLDSKENSQTGHEPVLEILLNHAASADDAARLGGVGAAGYVQANDFRLTDDRAPTPASSHYIQNTPNPQNADFNVASGVVRGNLTVLGALNANVGGNFIQNRTTPQPGASFHISGDGTVGGRLSGGEVNAATHYALNGTPILRTGPIGINVFGGPNVGHDSFANFGNVIFGANSGTQATEGTAFYNAFFGWEAGKSTTAGCCNSFFGNRAGTDNTTGAANAFFGGLAGGSNISGTRNAFFGDLAGFDLDLSGVGLEPGTNTGVTTGSFNTFVGSRSGLRITTGSNNTFVGYYTIGAPNLNYATAIGSGATVTTDNTIVLGRSNDTVRVPGALSLNIVDAATEFRIAGRNALRSTTDSTVTVGIGAGSSNPGVHNTFVGDTAGAANTGFSNVFVGWNAGALNGNGNFNTFVGTWAGRENTSGIDNSFFGDGTGSSNTIGSNNSYFGADAGRGCEIGFKVPCVAATNTANNSFFGAYAGHKSAAGGDNAYFGYRAGYHSVSSNWNAFFGSYAGENTTSSYNAFFGAQAGKANTSGSLNAFLGTEAGSHNLDGGSNVFVGVLAGVFNTSGSLNTFVGTQAGFNNQESHNSFFGTNAGYSNVTGHHNSFFGRGAGASSTANYNAFFGVGTGELTTSGGSNAFFGTGAGRANVTGADNTFVGFTVGEHNVGGSQNTLVGALADVAGGDLTFATALGAGAVVDASNTVVLGRPVDTVRVPGSLSIAGTFAAAAFSGNGAGLTGLDASKITSGTLANGRLGLIPTANLADAAVTSSKIAPGQVVRTLNGLTDVVSLAAGANVAITSAGNTLTISAAGGGAGNAVLNQTTVQPAANFNIDGTGAAGRFDAATSYSIAGTRMLSASVAAANLFVGAGAGQATLPGTPDPGSGRDNAFFGHNAGAANISASANAFFGSEAGLMLRENGGNSFFGYQAGRQSLASGNAFFGMQAGVENSMGVGNAFFGFQAGRYNTQGSYNAFFGNWAGFWNVAGGNSFFGSESGFENTTGTFNSYFGGGAGRDIVTGNENSMFGAEAGTLGAANSSRNSIFGARAGTSNKANDNVFVGASAGRFNIAGSGNTFVGSNAGFSNSSGSVNTLLGFSASVVEGITNSTAVGANARAGQSDSLVLGNNVSVGIGTSTPRARLDVEGGHILVGSPGQGIILKSPDGGTCRLLTIANGTGDLTLTSVSCPM